MIQLAAVSGELVLPNLMLSMSADHVAAFTLWAHDAGHIAVTCDFLFHPTRPPVTTSTREMP